MRIALAQVNPTTGDLEGNLRLALEAAARGAEAGARLVVLPELVITGYPPQDLLTHRDFIAAARDALERLAREAPRGLAVLAGFPEAREVGAGRELFNAAALLEDGEVRCVVRKRLLPTYDVFDEDRYFEAAWDEQQPVPRIDGVPVGISICEDMWNPADIGTSRRLHRVDPIGDLAGRAALLVNVSASPYDRRKVAQRQALIASHVRRHRKPFVFCNQVGGDDELVFDGTSCAFDARGELRAQAPMFAEDLLLVDVDPETGEVAGQVTPRPAREAREVFEALVLGTRDYARKCGFDRALLGLSGGIDSALTAAVAAAALGPDAVLGVSMPSRFSSQGSKDDAVRLAENLGIRLETVPIEPMFEAFLAQLEAPFAGRPWDVTEENIQARIRGVILMALSNKERRLLLTTGNKSELAVGYCTLYGDMAGGLAVISDVPKVLVYEVCRELNRDREVIPASTLGKPPSAELAPDQRDIDSLPPYEVLDPILERYIERQEPIEAIVAAGFERTLVERVVRLVLHNEYKRRQAAPGLRVTSKAFGVGRRYPIAKRVHLGASRLTAAARPHPDDPR